MRISKELLRRFDELQRRHEAEASQELQEAQEIVAAIERLRPAWQADSSSWPKIAFSGNTRDGVYEGYISGIIYSSEDDDHGYAMIVVTLLTEVGRTTVFNKKCSRGPAVFYLKSYIENNQAFKEEISRREFERSQQMEAERIRKEFEKEARNRFLGQRR